MMNGRTLLGPLALAVLAAASAPAQTQTDPLPSWNDEAAKRAIVRFVSDTTREGGASFVSPEDRVAVFDNDGTLWAERPLYFQLAFALDRVRTLAPEHPEWSTTEPFASVLKGDLKGVLAGGHKAVLELMTKTHAGMTTDEFSQVVSDWLGSARHPRFDRAYTELVYRPMLELLSFLRSRGFETYIVSGGGVEFMRVWAEKVYGIPPGHVVGSSIETKFEMRDGKPVILRLPRIDFIDDGEGKPVGIHKFIGKRPVIAFGNSDGDLQMFQWTAAGAGPRFIGIIHHTDSDREWAYDRASSVGRLDKALDEASAQGWTVVDMKKDWVQIFPFSQ